MERCCGARIFAATSRGTLTGQRRWMRSNSFAHATRSRQVAKRCWNGTRHIAELSFSNILRTICVSLLVFVKALPDSNRKALKSPCFHGNLLSSGWLTIWTRITTLGTGWDETGKIGHFWPEDKAIWLRSVLNNLKIDEDSLVAVGDSYGDIPCCNLRVAATLLEAFSHQNYGTSIIGRMQISTRLLATF